MAGQGRPPAGGSSKKVTKSSDRDDTADSSYIVFSNATEDSKGSRKKKATNDRIDPTSATNDRPKKSDSRTLIGGASWTGKLPVNLLSELCQKQKWEKPEYTMTKSAEGFSSTVILRAIHSKSKEMSTLPAFRLPQSHKQLATQGTATEARNFAATYTLYRVCSMKNMQLMLPPIYRTIWKQDFQYLKEEDLKHGKAWMYEADPFMAKQEQDQGGLSGGASHSPNPHRAGPNERDYLDPGMNQLTGTNTSSKRGWNASPRIDMGKRLRIQLEELIRIHANWNPYNCLISSVQQQEIIREFKGLGFRSSHIEEATAICKDADEVLEWLLIHVPEDDLPSWTLPEGYFAGISMASGNIKRQAAINRLADSGYSADLCAKALDDHDNDEMEAAEYLQNVLLFREKLGPSLSFSPLDSLSSLNAWNEELVTLGSIYDDRFQKLSLDSCCIRLDLGSGSPTLLIKKSKAYPSTPPIISLSKELPAYLRLSAYRQCLEYVQRHLLGEPMTFNIVDWLESSIPGIVENPGKLRDLTIMPSEASRIATPKATTASSYMSARRATPQQQEMESESLKLLQKTHDRQKSPEYQKILIGRKSLPSWKLREEIVNAVKNHQITIISGETGSGKSTQSVQFILDDLIERKLGSSANIICTQPRRLSVLGLADRVSEERCSIAGEEVGFTIRGVSKHTRGITKITFVTTGVLLRRLQTLGGCSHDTLEALSDVSHVFIDEVHERSLDTDFLLVLLKTVLRLRKDFKVILMSATLDAEAFERYFKPIAAVGKIHITGRMFPVTDMYLDEAICMSNFANSNPRDVPQVIMDLGMRINYDLIVAVVEAIDDQLGVGGILIFLPGVMEISRTINALKQRVNIHALPLHASLSPMEQRQVFQPAPGGMRKVIASTNVAETSVTIEDIIAVIDTGKVKETRFDPSRNMVILEEVWASKAASKQRRGRAGRVQAGTCFKLYTQNIEAKMAETSDPEIKRVPLEQLCLSVRAMGVRDIPGFLAKALTPPDVATIEGAIATLRAMGALDGDDLTALGRHLALIPADLRLGKLMVYGALFGCLESCVTIAAILTLRSPFLNSHEMRETSKSVRSRFACEQGDLIADLNAYQEWSHMMQSARQHEVRKWCLQNCLSFQTLSEISSNRSQYFSSLKDVGFILPGYSKTAPESQSLNTHNSNFGVLRALVAGSFHPQLARIQFPDKKYAASLSGAVELDPDAKTIKYFAQDAGRVFIHPSSTLFGARGFVSNSVYMAYFTKIETAKVYIRDLAPFNSYSLLMFGGAIAIDKLGRGLTVDGWLHLRGWARIGVLVGRLRAMLDEILAQRMENPNAQKDHDIDVIEAVRKLVELDGMDR